MMQYQTLLKILTFYNFPDAHERLYISIAYLWDNLSLILDVSNQQGAYYLR